MTAKEENNLYKELLHPVLEKYGFIAKNKSSFVATKSFGWDRLEYDLLKGSSGERRFGYIFRRRYEQIEELLKPHYELLNIQPQIEHATLVANKSLLDPKIYQEGGSNVAGYSYPLTEEGIRGFVTQFSEDMENIILPVLNRYESLTELDKLANQPPGKFKELWTLFSKTGLLLKKVIIARLVDNPDYLKVIDAVKGIIESWRTADPKETEQWLKGLDNIIADLKTVSPAV
jgi:hypothetical protein